MAAPAFGTIGTHHNASGTGPAFAVPASVASGDIIVIPMFIDGGATISAMATGFAHAPNSPVANPGGGGGAGSHSLAVVWKRATGADSGSYTFTLSSGVYAAGSACRYTGCVASGSPWDPFTSAAAATNTTSATVTPAVSGTTAGPDRMLVFSGTNWSGGTSGAAWTPPTGFTERMDTADGVNTLADLVKAAAGATGSITATCTGNDKESAWLGALIGTTATSSTITPVRPRLWLPVHQRASWW